MATRSRRKKKTEPSPEEIPVEEQEQEQTIPETVSTPIVEAADTLPPTPPRASFEELIYIALAAWRFEMIPKGVLYKMTRTFAHFQNGEKYDTGVIFRELEHFKQGKHGQFLEKVDSFCEMVMDEAKAYLATKSVKS